MIYCVEDDAGIRELVVYTLQNTGMEARGFADGTALFSALRSEKPDLILLDIMLPARTAFPSCAVCAACPTPPRSRSSF